jgi:ABC-type multidrug transport system fused ATPase/permease subunit
MNTLHTNTSVPSLLLCCRIEVIEDYFAQRLPVSFIIAICMLSCINYFTSRHRLQIARFFLYVTLINPIHHNFYLPYRPRFLRTHLKRMEYNQKFFFHLWMCTSWLTARLEISTSFILFSISILCVCLREEISPVALGLALTYGLQLNALFQRVVQVTIDIMSYMISTERVLEYCEIPPEPTTVPTFQDTHSSIEILKEHSDSVETSSPSAGAGGSTLHPEFRSQLFTLGGLTASRPRQGPILDLPPNWPSQGIVRFDNVWMQYRDNPAVLRGISFTTLPAMRIGISLIILAHTI